MAKAERPDAYILRVGRHDLYVPRSWLEYSALISDGGKAASVSPAYTSFIRPAFEETEPAGTIHTVFGNPPLGHGAPPFLLRGGTDDMAPHIASGSFITKLGFLEADQSTSSLNTRHDFSTELHPLPGDGPWAEYSGYWWDTAKFNHQFPERTPHVSRGFTAQGMQYELGDLEVIYDYHGPLGDRGTPAPLWSPMQSGVHDLVTWLATKPEDRDNAKTFKL